jgi:hypothetical protein
MDVGPIERIHLIKSYTERILVNIINHIYALGWITHRFGQVHHLPKPINMDRIVGLKGF